MKKLNIKQQNQHKRQDEVVKMAIQFSLAGMQVLLNHFGFSGEQAQKWLDLTTEQVAKNTGTTGLTGPEVEIKVRHVR